MAKIVPKASLRLMPEEDIVNHSLRYLRTTENSDPAARHRIVALPYGNWGDCGFAYGKGMESLDFPDNSILFLAARPSKSGFRIILPPSGSFIDSPDGARSSVDNGVIEKMSAAFDREAVFSIELLEAESALFLSLPMAIESSRLRRRGIPLCTPVIIELPPDCEIALARVCEIIWHMVDEFGLGAVCHCPQLTIPRESGSFSAAASLLKNAVSSLVPDFVPQANLLIEKVTGKNVPLTHLEPMALLHGLAWSMLGSVFTVAETKSAAPDGSLFSHLVFGLSENQVEHHPLLPEERKTFWKSVNMTVHAAPEVESLNVGDVFTEMILPEWASPCIPQSLHPASLSENLSTVAKSVPAVPEDPFAQISVRIHFGCRETHDPLRLRPRPGSSLLAFNNGETKAFVSPSETKKTDRMAWLQQVVAEGGNSLLSCSVQTLATNLSFLSVFDEVNDD